MISMKSDSIEFCKEIYDIGTIEFAISEYKHIAKITANENKVSIVCKFDDCTYDSDLTILQFCNFLINAMNCKRVGN